MNGTYEIVRGEFVKKNLKEELENALYHQYYELNTYLENKVCELREDVHYFIYDENNKLEELIEREEFSEQNAEIVRNDLKEYQDDLYTRLCDEWLRGE